MKAKRRSIPKAITLPGLGGNHGHLSQTSSFICFIFQSQKKRQKSQMPLKQAPTFRIAERASCKHPPSTQAQAGHGDVEAMAVALLSKRG